MRLKELVKKYGARWHNLHCGGDKKLSTHKRKSLRSCEIAEKSGFDVDTVRRVLVAYRREKFKCA